MELFTEMLQYFFLLAFNNKFSSNKEKTARSTIFNKSTLFRSQKSFWKKFVDLVIYLVCSISLGISVSVYIL